MPRIGDLDGDKNSTIDAYVATRTRDPRTILGTFAEWLLIESMGPTGASGVFTYGSGYSDFLYERLCIGLLRHHGFYSSRDCQLKLRYVISH